MPPAKAWPQSSTSGTKNKKLENTSFITSFLIHLYFVCAESQSVRDAACPLLIKMLEEVAAAPWGVAATALQPAELTIGLSRFFAKIVANGFDCSGLLETDSFCARDFYETMPDVSHYYRQTCWKPSEGVLRAAFKMFHFSSDWYYFSSARYLMVRTIWEV